MFETIEIERRGPVAHVWMNRPQVHNAFNAALIAELDQAWDQLAADDSVRVVVLGGRGKSFSAGADLNWMKEAAGYSEAENLEDARRLAGMLQKLAQLPRPTIARVQGAALGGGTGLAAACDICVAAERAVFATSEVKFGIIPSAISPYVIRAIGPRQASRYFQSAERMSAARAEALGLVHEVGADDAEVDTRIDVLVAALLEGGPKAQAAAKALIVSVTPQPIGPAVLEDTARRIATLRATTEAKEGLGAFLDKRPASWMATD
ncbi:MAG: enoyl-CoA hydratase/isomerase family protein [Rhodocyclaceae bacterium]|nr:enoyl-CoA hydratase/isomerase family protein [Rhodocyclaceae bacterium]